jgi:hypothetical protein
MAASRSRLLLSLPSVMIRLMKTPMAKAAGNFHSQPGLLNQAEIVDRNPKS